MLGRPSAVVPGGLVQQRNRQFRIGVVLAGDMIFPLGNVFVQFVFLVVECVVVVGGAVEGWWVVEVTVGLLVDVFDLGLEVFEVLVDGGLGFGSAEFVVLVEDVEVRVGEDVVGLALLLDEPLYPLYLCENAANEYLKLLLQVGVDGLQLLVFLSGHC